MKPIRPHMPLSVKLEAAILQLGMNPRRVQYHHNPELAARYWNTKTGEYEPAANDPLYIRLIEDTDHAALTNTDNGTGRSSKGVVAHVKRAAARQAEHETRMEQKGSDQTERPQRRRRSQFPCSRDSRFKKKFSGKVVPR